MLRGGFIQIQKEGRRQAIRENGDLDEENRRRHRVDEGNDCADGRAVQNDRQVRTGEDQVEPRLLDEDAGLLSEGEHVERLPSLGILQCTHAGLEKGD